MKCPTKLSIDWLLSLSLFLFLFSSSCLLGTTGATDFWRDPRPRPCTAGYGVLQATDDLLELEDNEGCNFLKGEVPFIEDTCIKLLEQGPCERGEWLIIDDDTDMLVCEKRECKEGYVKFDDSCVSFDDRTKCKSTFELVVSVHGEGECECSPGYLYYPDTEKCYVPYTRGPCRSYEIIKMKIDDNTGIGTCETNPCPKEKMTPLDSHCLPQDDTYDSRCYTIGKQTPCKGGSYLLIEPSLSKPFCLAQKPNSIIPRIVKRAAPCQLSYTNSCVRACDGPQYYYYRGARCEANYAFMFNSGRPICLRGRCRRTSL